VALIVEISDTSLTYDLETKAALYARSGVPEYWVVAARKRQVHRHWTPEQDGYRNKDVISFGDLLESATMPDLAVDTEGLV
jgi:Uma2 family endonuclease